MKKTIYALIFTVLLVGLSVSSGFSATDCTGTIKECDTITDTTGLGSGIVNMQFSPNVLFGYNGAAENYAIGSFNTSGTKSYGVTDDYSGIYRTKTDSTTAATLPGASAAWTSTTWVEVAK